MRLVALVLVLALAASSSPLRAQDGAAPVPSASGSAEAPDAEGPVRAGYCVVLPDEPVDPSITAEWNGRSVAFCCKMCRKQFLADPAQYADRLPPLAAPPSTVAGSTTDAQADAPAAASAADDGRPRDWWALLGRLHPLVVHFPIALLILAGVAEALARPGDARWRPRARFLLALGAPWAALAAWLGWLAAQESHYPTLTEVLWRHRWLGVSTAAVALLALALAPRQRAVDLRRDRLYRWLLFAVVVLVVLAGHHGGRWSSARITSACRARSERRAPPRLPEAGLAQVERACHRRRRPGRQARSWSLASPIPPIPGPARTSSGSSSLRPPRSRSTGSRRARS